MASFSVPHLSGRVLLAEDGLCTQRLVLAFLKRVGLGVTVAGNGRDAVEIALRQPFDLILMDMQMPLLDGIDAARTLRGACYDRPIVALTANVMPTDVQRYLAAGCDDVLAKPIQVERFYTVVAEQLAATSTRSGDCCADLDFTVDLGEVAALFREGLPARMDAIRCALAREDKPALYSLLHVLQGTAGSFGFSQLGSLAAVVESGLRGGIDVQAKGLCDALFLEARAALLATATSAAQSG